MIPTRPCWAEIRTGRLEDNFRLLAGLAAPHAELMAVIKGDAYGHSLALCAPAAVRAGAGWLGVTSVEEGVAARTACALLSHPRILIMGGVFPGQAEAVVEHHLTAAVWEPWQLHELEAAAQAAGLTPGSLPVHLEIDTGMSRQGVAVSALEPLLARFTPASPLRLEAVMTHLFAADEADQRVTREQLAELDRALGHISAAGHFAEWLSVGNSATLLAGQAGVIADLAARHGMKALMRPGLALYGVAPEFDPPFAEEPAALAAARAGLKPVLSWKTQVVGVRAVSPGAAVGYNGVFVATEPMRLALIAAGYADGLQRRLGNRFAVLVRGRRAPLVGRVSMDQSVIDVTEISGVAPGDEAVLLGAQGTETISAYEQARAAGTIPWEIFTGIAQRVRRVAV
ncbi:MAG TPA: alanine racemase [Terracidiphilus sp.]|nr:alanine racemase [Terracidiphilus sp.]